MSWVTPVIGRISSKFGYRVHPITGVRSLHGGTDIAAATGTTVAAVTDGTVVVVSRNDLAGNYINIQHADGIKSRYLHLSKTLVRVGQKVKVGQKIGEVGATGRVTGAHTHLEIHVNGTKVDPQPFLRDRGVIVGSKEKVKPKASGGIDVAKLPIIRAGAKNTHVGIMQGALIARGFSVGKYGVDKSNGPATQKAVNAYQKKYPSTGTNNKPDNTCGPKMWAHLLGV